MSRKRKKSLLSYISIPRPSLDLDPETKKGIFIVLILAFGAIAMLSLFDMAGNLGIHLKDFLTAMFGWGRWLFPAVLLVWGYMLYDEERFEVRGGNYLGIIIFFLSFQALLFLFIDMADWPARMKAGAGGGYVGLLLAKNFMNLMGFWASLIVTLCLLIVSILLAFNTTLVNLFGRDSLMAKVLYPFNFILGKLFGWRKEEEEVREEDEEEEEEEDEEEEDEDEEEDEGEEDEEEEQEEDEENEEEEDEEEEEEEEKEEEIIPVQPKKEPAKEEIWWKKTGLEINIPISLLSGKIGKPTSGDIKANSEIIRHALENFGIQVEMGDICIGPTVTQYTFKPAEGVKLSRITNLSNDLALALAAHPIRIEAPIPGKALVGIEVPNQAKAVVSLKEVLKSKKYKERKNDLYMALGKDVAGNVWLDDISRMPHMLVAGATNSGKSVCLNSIIVSLMYQNNPDDLRFIMVDPKRVELPVYNDIPYLLTPVITDVPKTINSLKWCLNEMDRRFDLLQKSGHRNIQTYNENAKLKMPYIVFIIDELADLMVVAAKDIESGIIRLAQMARAVGIHLILATQRPSVDVITGLIKANMPARIAFSVASGTDSRTILDSLGAEKLLGRGDMLFMNAELSKPVRLQGAFLSDDEIKKVVRYVKSKSKKLNYIESITDRQRVVGIAGGLDTSGDESDELFQEAKDLVINMGKASASLLQRKLRIGYARAASLLDAMEEAGVIGPANGAKPREIMISKEQYASMGAVGVSGAALHRREESKAPDEYFESIGEDSSENPPVFNSGKIDDEDHEEEEDEEDDEEEEEKPEDEDEMDEEDESEDEEEDEEDIEEDLEVDEEDKKESEEMDRLFSK